MDFSTLQGGRFETGGSLVASSQGTTLTSSSSAHTKGSYVELIASTAFNADGILLAFASTAARQEYLVDLAIGAGGSEQIIAADLYFHNAAGSNASPGGMYFLPIAIPAGTRISARCQAVGTSQAMLAVAILMGGGFGSTPPLQRVTTYGANAADTGSVSIDPGGTANTKGSYSEIVASTTNPIKMLFLILGNQGNGVRTDCQWLVDLAIGAGGSEQVVISNFPAGGSTGADSIFPSVIGPIPCSIPAGTRLAVRAQCSITDATDRLFDAMTIGVD